MLTPEFYESCADELITLYSQLENDIIADVVRRVLKTDIVTETAKHQIEMLQESGYLYNDILSQIGKSTNKTNAEVKRLFENAGVMTINADNQIYIANGLNTLTLRQSPAMLQTLEAGYRKTLGNLNNLTLTTANTSQTLYYNACNQAYMQLSSGAFSYQQAIKNAIEMASKQGASVLYPSGHTDRIDVAVRRSVLTGLGQTCREIGLMNAQEVGSDLMEITAHSGARPNHATWQGQIVSLSGRKGYLSKADIGYGTGDGFGGWNCRHDWFPFFEGYSQRNYTQSQLDELDARNIKYNGKMYTEYEISQIQRKKERDIRSAKREQTAFKVAVSETNGELKETMQHSLNYSNQLVKSRQADMREFINATHSKRDYFREQNYGLISSEKNKIKNLTNEENKRILKEKVTNGEISLVLNVEKQNPHIYNSIGYDIAKNKSYFTISISELQEIINSNYATGVIRISPNGQIKEILNTNNNIGVCVNVNGEVLSETNRFTIHYSKNRTHIVPAKRSE